jgi:hypothetical protein
VLKPWLNAVEEFSLPYLSADVVKALLQYNTKNGVKTAMDKRLKK